MSEKPEMFDTVLYGVISVTVVSLLSLGGACIGPLMAKDAKHRWLHFFLAMAVSTLSSDAILHIIPQVVGVHSHSHGHDHGHEHHHENSTHVNGTEGHGHSHHHEHEDDNDDILWYTVTPSRRNLLRLSVIVLSIYILYFVEFFLFYRKTHLHYCSPSTKSPVTALSPSTSSEVKSSVSNTSGVEENNNGEESEGRMNSVGLGNNRKEGGHELISLREDDDDAGEICGLKPRALIILFGDGLHNLVDGLAIGASFMISLKLGFITTIAVVCHELPHEIGDLAVLIDSGLTMCTALILNLLSALTAYIGFFIAVVLGKDPETETILLAITAGMFLYVAWVDMLSHLKHDSLMADHWLVTSLLQLSGFMIGFALIFGLGWFEHLLETGGH